jgi:GNAT superfamily N-acetyltransferase
VLYSFTRPIPPAALQHLFQQTLWAANRSPEDIRALLESTPVCLGAWLGDELVGFARAITDDRYRALIEDVVVESSLRGQGIGSAMLAHLIERLAHVEELLLLCDDARIGFYQRHGFVLSEYPRLVKRRQAND